MELMCSQSEALEVVGLAPLCSQSDPQTTEEKREA